MGVTKAVNIYKEGCDVYCARSTAGTVSMDPGGTGYFGNPFKIGSDGDRDAVIEKYRVYFKERLKDPVFATALWELKGRKLGCFCKPESCHVDIIVAYLEGQPWE